jgi:hypothetical protein
MRGASIPPPEFAAECDTGSAICASAPAMALTPPPNAHLTTFHGVESSQRRAAASRQARDGGFCSFPTLARGPGSGTLGEMAPRHDNGSLALPVWAKKPPVNGVLTVPTALAGTLKKALGPTGRLFVPSTRFVAFEAEGVWGLSRQLHLTKGNAKDLRHALEVLASHELPVLHLDLLVDVGAAGALAEVLASPAAAHLSALIIGLAEPFEVAGAVASAVQRMPGLRRLELVARGAGAVIPRDSSSLPALARLSDPRCMDQQWRLR